MTKVKEKTMLERDVVIEIVRSLLGRDPIDEDSITYWSQKPSIETVIREITQFDEYVQKLKGHILNPGSSSMLGAVDYCRPPELRRVLPNNKKVLLIGTCLVQAWVSLLPKMFPGCVADHYLFNNLLSKLPEKTAQEIREIDFQVINIPTRKVFSDTQTIRTQLMSGAETDALTDSAKQNIAGFLAEMMPYNVKFGLETYCTNFIAPQFNALGRMFSRYEASNTIRLYEELNRFLDQEVRKYRNAYVIDINNLAGVYGKRFISDDGVWITSHGGILSDFDAALDRGRMEVPSPMTRQYDIRPRDFISVIWNELFSMHGTIAQEDSVKLVVTDLDDTLWRGVIGDQDADTMEMEGWPLGYLESLSVLKQRGILVGVVSKNSESIVESRWSAVTRDKIRLEDFAIKRINWAPKVQNMQEILADVNLLPKSVVYIDDNPVERAAMCQAFPDMRVIGSNPYVLKRILLWSPETQVAAISAESGSRTEMVQAQSKRNMDMKSQSREDFLRSLNLQIRLERIESQTHAKYPRSFELINKTNQFNTSGKRWTAVDIINLLADGGYLVAFSVSDTYTNYGLVGVLLLKASEIIQFVMSCRVIGLNVETAAISFLVSKMRDEGAEAIRGTIRETAANAVCRNVYKDAGFRQDGEAWVIDRTAVIVAPPYAETRWA